MWKFSYCWLTSRQYLFDAKNSLKLDAKNIKHKFSEILALIFLLQTIFLLLQYIYFFFAKFVWEILKPQQQTTEKAIKYVPWLMLRYNLKEKLTAQLNLT